MKITCGICSYQLAIEDITKRMGAGMAKFICQEVRSYELKKASIYSKQFISICLSMILQIFEYEIQYNLVFFLKLNLI